MYRRVLAAGVCRQSAAAAAARAGRAMCCYTVCMPQEPADQSTRITILNNGIRVATEFRPQPLASVALVTEAGPRFESAHLHGISHLVEHMAYKGFNTIAQPHFDNQLRLMGARMDVETRRDEQTFIATTLPEAVPNVLDALARIVTDLALDPCMLECARCNILLESQEKDLDPRALVFDYLHQTAFQGTPLARGIIGPSANVMEFETCQVVEYICRHYQPYKLCVVSSGFVEHEAMVEWTNARLGHLHGDACCVSDDGPCRFTGSQIIYRDDSMRHAHVAIAFQAPGFHSPEYYHLLVAACIVGAWDKSRGGGYNNGSYLARASALTECCERYEAFYLPYRDVGLWGVYFVGNDQHLDEMVLSVQDELMALCQMPTESDVERGVAQAMLQVARRNQGTAAAVRDIGTEVLYTCGRTSVKEKYDLLRCIETQGIIKACKNMMYDRCPAVAAVGPTETLPDYVRIRAGQYWLRI